MRIDKKRLISILMMIVLFTVAVDFKQSNVLAEAEDEISFLDFACAELNTVAITKNGDIYSWKEEPFLPEEEQNENHIPKATKIEIKDNIRSVSVNPYNTAVITEDGDVYCWGENSSGEVGNGKFSVVDEPELIFSHENDPDAIIQNVRVKEVAYSGNERNATVAALTEDGRLYCWGNNQFGQIGNGTQESCASPQMIMENVKSFSFKRNTVAAINNNGELFCWGGILGASGEQLTPLKVMRNVKMVSVGYSHIAIIAENDELYCWGDNSCGQLGDGTTISKKEPVKIMSNVKSVSTGYWNTAAITNDNDLYCWGNNSFGQVGNGNKSSESNGYAHTLLPEKILSNVASVSFSFGNATALTLTGDLYAWGMTVAGGDGTETCYYTEQNLDSPQLVLSNVKKVEQSYTSVVCLTNDGSIYYCGFLDTTDKDCFVPVLRYLPLVEKTKIANDKYQRPMTHQTMGAYLIEDEGEIPVVLEEAQLFRRDSNKYNHSLARFSIEMATMCYSHDCLDDDEESGIQIRRVYEKLGFSGFKYEPDNTNEGKYSPFFIGFKNVTFVRNEDGKTKKTDSTIIVLSIRGTSGKEWLDNFEPGEGDIHKGFQCASNHIYDLLKKYIEEHYSEMEKDVKILINGHSRGAAVANLLGAKIDDCGLSSGIDTKVKMPEVSEKNTFVYTFATPNTTSRSDRSNSKYNNIYNIVNPEDFVTKVLPSAWGYGRYGITYVLPSKSTEGRGDYYVDYEPYLREVQSLFKQYRPGFSSKYQPYSDGARSVSKYVNMVTTEVKTIKEYYNKSLLPSYKELLIEGYSKRLYNLIPGYKVNVLKQVVSSVRTEGVIAKRIALQFSKNNNLVYTLKQLFYGFLGKFEAGKEQEALSVVAECGYNFYGKLGTETILFFLIHQGAAKIPTVSPDFECAHTPETYLAALETLTEDEVMQSRRNLYGIVNCPVDITIKDTDDQVVGQIVNNKVVKECKNVVMEVDGDSKSFSLPYGANYNIELQGNDDGTLDYSLCEIEADEGEKKRVFYNDLKISKDIKYTQNITEKYSVTDSILKDNEGKTIEAEKVLDNGEIGTLSVDVDVEGIGEATGKCNLSYGDYVCLEATTDENNKFLGWYDENERLVSTETKLTFSISENRYYKAKFTNIIVEAKQIKFEKSSLSVKIGETICNDVVIIPQNVTLDMFILQSSDENVAKIDALGNIIAVSAGRATITAMSLDGKAIASFKVTVQGNVKKTKRTVKVQKPAGTTIKKLKVKKKKKSILVTWKKVSGITGYKLQYSLKKNFKKAKTITIKNNKITSKTLKKLKFKKKYYIRICTYKRTNKKVYCSSWSKPKKKRIK